MIVERILFFLPIQIRPTEQMHTFDDLRPVHAAKFLRP